MQKQPRSQTPPLSPEGDDFLSATRGSREAFERQRQSIAGGSTRGGIFSGDYPIFIDRGEGCYVWDVDGNRYVDFINASFALPLGHNHAAIREAMARQLEKGTFFTAHNETEWRLAETLCRRIPSVEKLRFCCSGTEATMFAARGARVFTGRSKIAKMQGGFHGTNDVLSTSLGLMSSGVPSTSDYDPVKEAVIGIPPEVFEGTLLLSFNDPAFCERVIERNKDDLAAVFVEPVMGSAGMIPPRDGFLQFLRDITRRYGILLVFDEMISLGIAPGGAQEHYGVTPDMTCCGKVIGGGMPIGCVGGSEEVMEVFDLNKRMPYVNHGGTFAGHPLSMVAGLAQQEAMTPEVYQRLHRLGDRLRSMLRELFDDLGAPIQVTGVGQLFCFHVTPNEVYNYETASTGDADKLRQIMNVLPRHGIHQVKTSRGSVSAPMEEEHLAAYVRAMEAAVQEAGLASR